MDTQAQAPAKTIIKSIRSEFVMPAGTYYVGDPCYAIRDKWDSLLNHTECNFFEAGGNGAALIFEGHPVCAFGTAYGDGTYRDDNGNRYGVDAGLLGVVAAELVDNERAWELGRKVEFKHNFTCLVVEQGDSHKICLGSIAIETGDDQDDDDEDYDC